jgi:pimeloyl-ACP methyl ester carboxylesterase
VPAVSHAVVIVSGGDAISPFTTPDEGCRDGMSAGSTDTALREALLSAGLAVFTSPATAGLGQALSDPGFAGFAEPPLVLPEEMTVNALGPIDEAGGCLATFLAWLSREHGVMSVDLVGHSMGGLFSRAAIRELATDNVAPLVRRLVTIGTPWLGGFAADVAAGDLALTAADGELGTVAIIAEFTRVTTTSSTGAGEQVTRRYLADPGGWNDRQSGVLDGIAVTLIGGDHFRHEGGDPAVWPHDGLVALDSALAHGVPASVLPEHATHQFADVHSIYFADRFALPWETALTWDPAVHSVVIAALEEG